MLAILERRRSGWLSTFTEELEEDNDDVEEAIVEPVVPIEDEAMVELVVAIGFDTMMKLYYSETLWMLVSESSKTRERVLEKTYQEEEQRERERERERMR